MKLKGLLSAMLCTGAAALTQVVSESGITANAAYIGTPPDMFVYFDNSVAGWDNVYAYWYGDNPQDIFGNKYYGDQGKKMVKGTNGLYYISAPRGVNSIAFTNGVTDNECKFNVSSDGTRKTSQKAAFRTADYNLNYGYGCQGQIFSIDIYSEQAPRGAYNITKYNRMDMSEYYGDLPKYADIDTKSMTINAGSKRELTVIANNGCNCVFKSSNTNVATVDQNGFVKGVKAGTAEITVQVTGNGINKTLTCNVTVNGSSSGGSSTGSSSTGSSSTGNKDYDESHYSDNDYELKIKDGIKHTAFVTSYKGAESTIVIKEKIKGNTIIGVEPDDHGYESCLVYDQQSDYQNGHKGYSDWNSYLYYFKEVKLPSTIKTIGNNAFRNLRGLEKINLPEGIETIGSNAFVYCYKLKELTIPSTVKKISNNCFRETGLEKLIVKSDNITFEQLKNADIHENVTFYGYKGSEVERFVRKYDSDKNYSFYAIERPPKAVEKVNISKTAVTLGKGEKFSLTASALPTNASARAITWTSSNNNVAKVSNGQVTAVSNGTATITARTSNGKSARCTVTVKNAPTKITLTKGILTLGVGEKFTVGSGINNGAAAAKRTYRTSNSSIVKMTRTDWQGDFVGVKPGVAYVTVRTYNGKESTCKVTVKAAPTSVTISKKSMTMKVGQTATLSCSVPSNAGCATRTFRTSNSKIVKMTKTNWTGSFKAVARGTAYVTVRTYNGKESTCKITVK